MQMFSSKGSDAFKQASTRSEGGRQSFRLSYRMTPELLGKGSFGKVCKAVSSSSGEARAVKVVELLKAADGDLDEKRLAEARVEEHMMLRVGRHEHVVELLESFADLSSKRFYFVMEMCSCSIMDASEFVLTCDDQVFSKLMTDVARALAHIHKRGVVHRDVKPENLLFADSSKSSLKLCDFGLAAVAPKGELLPGRYGTLPFMSPEMAAASGHTFSTDLWSLGATLYLLIFGDYPYRPPKMSREHVKLAIVTGCVTPTYQRRSEVLPDRPEIAKDLVRELLARDRKNRPTAQQILRHEFCAKDTKIIGHVVSVATDKLKAALQVRIGFSAFACWRAQKEDDEDELGEPKRFARATTV